MTVVGSGALFYYVAQKDRTPGEQLPHDPTKKTLVVLGSGWGATSLLQKLDTTDYNVVCPVFIPKAPEPCLIVPTGCYQPEELLPLHSALAKCCRGYLEPSFHHSTWVSFSKSLFSN